MKCQNAINNCVIACDSDPSSKETCRGYLVNVKLAQNQAIENAKSYSQSQECENATSSCGNNSYNDPNCPQYCQKPGRQNDPLCTTQSGSAESGLAQLQQMNSKTIETSQNVGTVQNPRNKTMDLSVASANDNDQEFGGSKNNLLQSDDSLDSTASAAGSNIPNAVGAYASGTSNNSSALNPTTLDPTALNSENSENNNKNEIAALATVNSATNGGGGPSGGAYLPTEAGYPDSTFNDPPEETHWYDSLTKFLPLTDKQIAKNRSAYTKKS